MTPAVVMVLSSCGAWDGKDFVNWYRNFDGAATGFALSAEDRFTTLVACIGFPRVGEIMAQAKAEGKIPRDQEEAKKDAWLADYLAER